MSAAPKGDHPQQWMACFACEEIAPWAVGGPHGPPPSGCECGGCLVEVVPKTQGEWAASVDFEMDVLADKERSRDRRAWACLRKIVGGMMPDEVPQYAKGAYYDAKRLFGEVKAPDDGVKAAAPKVLIIERGVE